MTPKLTADVLAERERQVLPLLQHRCAHIAERLTSTSASDASMTEEERGSLATELHALSTYSKNLELEVVLQKYMPLLERITEELTPSTDKDDDGDDDDGSFDPRN